MRPSVEIVTSQTCQPEWDRFVDAHPDASAYHRWAWRGAFESAFRHETVYLAARAGGELAGLLPLVIFNSWTFGRFAVSLPFVNYGGLLAETDDAAEALRRAAVDVATDRRLAFVELRHRRRRLADLAVRQHKVAMLLPLAPDEDAMWADLDHKVRNQIRKAAKSGLRADTGGADLLADFYTVFARNMRDLGTPVYAVRFFEAVLDCLGDAGRVFVVRDGAIPVAAGISCEYRGTIEVPWASSLRGYRAMSPNNLLYWTVIRYAIARGLGTLDFGRSTPGEGTFHFKKQWGAVAEPVAWEYWLAGGGPLPDISPHNPRFRLAISVWKHLPVPVTTWLGPPVVRNIP